jgi:hypothetical protein
LYNTIRATISLPSVLGEIARVRRVVAASNPAMAGVRHADIGHGERLLRHDVARHYGGPRLNESTGAA